MGQRLNAQAEESPKVALVLGGGGAKGFVHIAILELLEELGIHVDMVAGVSSGAIVGGLYCAGYSPEMLREALSQLDWVSFFLDRPVSPFEDELAAQNLPLRFRLNGGFTPDWGKGYSTGETAYTLFKSLTVKIPSYIEFDKLPIPFAAGAVAVPEGRIEMIRRGDLAEAIRASMGIQGIFEPLPIDGQRYVDGGLLYNLPVREVRDMGYDVVIAVELFPLPERINTAPMDVLPMMNDLYSNRLSREQRDLADLVLMPDVQRFTTMDFSKAREIYSLAPGERERLKEALIGLKEKIASISESGVSGAAGTKTSIPAYGELPPIIPQGIAISGALPSDRSGIEKSFARLIRGKPLEQGKLSAFIREIYRTGNYRLVITRTDTRNGSALLDLQLYPDDKAKILLLAGGAYHGVLSSSSISKLSLSSGVQFLGLTGPGSALSLGSSVLDILSFRFMYLQPLSSRVFISVSGDIVRDQDIVIQGPLSNSGVVSQVLAASGSLKGGIRIGDHSALSIAPEIFWANTVDDQGASLAFVAALSFCTLDYHLFPSRGIYAQIGNTLYFPLPPDTGTHYDSLSLDLTGALPLSRKFSLIAMGGAETAFGLGEPSRLIPFGHFDEFDRVYFPHLAGRQPYAAHKAAASLALQFQPWKNLTILGGRMILSLSVAAGETTASWDEYKMDRIVWNGSFNMGIQLNKSFGLQFRAGAGGVGSQHAAPFISLDIGSF
ncbi:patatin-like phospholipase family protein [Leadbettera azotonutricia]|uniref:Phospholipase, patatin family n=1 Tax=Leadbettera azotonutricia (strain ATCC BAA-888 / DSM 13862 / ZAS-9) TaxID=545695 RepID=F5Y798_LEAAZ|nr:patatin-like phospholipase family protein [Leadbettera azotonutricia]AEF81221.1 phospholipase, patatin family [Leadbettera azotonutricia ZAS-9]